MSKLTFAVGDPPVVKRLSDIPTVRIGHVRRLDRNIERILKIHETNPEKNNLSPSMRTDLAQWQDRYDELVNPSGTFRQAGIKKGRCYVSIYAVTRHYGGPEEGGWYYNHHRRVFTSRQISWHKVHKVGHRALLQFIHYAWGNIYSVKGGLDIQVRHEQYVGEHETKHRPTFE